MKPHDSSNDKGRQGRHEHRLRHEINDQEKENARKAHEQAEKDMNEDAELTSHNPNDDLDEGEKARLGEDTDRII